MRIALSVTLNDSENPLDSIDPTFWVVRHDRPGRGLLKGSCFSAPGRFAVEYGGEPNLICTSKNEVSSASDQAWVWIEGFLQGSMPAAKSDDPTYLREWEAAREEFLRSGNWRLPDLGNLYMEDDRDRFKNSIMSSVREQGEVSDAGFKRITERIDVAIATLASVEFQSDEFSGEHLPQLILGIQRERDLPSLKAFRTVVEELSRASESAVAALGGLVAEVENDE